MATHIRLSEYNVAWTTAKLEHYGKQIGLADIGEWTFIWTPTEWNRSGFRGYHNAYSWNGICSVTKKAIMIKIRRHKRLKCRFDGDVDSVEWTVCHELVHARFPNLRHGAEFNKRMSNVLAGKIYPPLQT